MMRALLHRRAVITTVLGVGLLLTSRLASLPVAHAEFQKVVFVDLTRLRLFFTADGKYYPIAAGERGEDGRSHTPKGKFKVIEKGKDPLYIDAQGKFVAGPYKTDKNNVYGTRFIRLDKVINGRNLGIHGTNEPGLIGTYSSHACIRMKNEDVEAIFDLIEVGTRVEIF